MSTSGDPSGRFGNWISEGWKMFVAQWQTWVLLALASLVVIALPTVGLTALVIASSIASGAAQAGSHAGPEASVFPFVLFMFGLGFMILIVIPLQAYFAGGMYKSAFKQLRGEQLEFRDLFSGGDCFLALLGETILASILVFIGSLMCIIPGFIVLGLLIFAAPLIIERRLGVFDAMRESYEMTKQNILVFTLFAVIVQLIVSAGSYLCYVGVLATYPLMFTMTAVAYRDCFGLPGARSFLAPTQMSSPPYASSSAYEPPQPQVRTCASCQNELPPTATFCFRCGARAGS